MSAQINRRSFIGLASGAALGISAGVKPAAAQSPYLLTAEIVTVEHGFNVTVTYDVYAYGSVPLYVQFASSAGAKVFFTWNDITDPSGTAVEPIGPFDLPDDSTYVIAIVNGVGEIDPNSPVLQLTVPAYPTASF